ncbi:lysophospholipid acyltransferase 5 [Protopterus annectens]|uniref:lysophospholipid acyltransferase 5 n=1 Tax=Protopterus annectens TaxID=7888 RepID=UPI001CFA6AFE|nr:lysophospholipid acyltransferase 5 [Protopterus annectens]
MAESELVSGADGWLSALAASLGSSEPALRLVISIFLGYPFALLYRYILFDQSPSAIHIYHTVIGLWIAYFNFGGQLYHSLLCVVVQFLVIRLMGKTVTAVLTSFIFQMGYLLGGYYCTATEQYDIKWTMPHCVLTLKLVGLAFDYYDGGKDKTRLSKEQEVSAIQAVPSFLEVTGFSYFYGGFSVGPQFTMNNYLKLINREMTDVPGQRPNCIVPALTRLSVGLFFMVIFLLTSGYVPVEYLLTDEFENQPFWYRCVYIAAWGKVALYKYVSCWLIAEGVCIMTGLAYNGKDETGKAKWDGCANMKVWLFETTPLFTGTIASFNINTNAWVARHIFKRLKFLGNKLASQAFTLLFLAVWHGLHSGYFMCFFLEFITVVVEKQELEVVQGCTPLKKIIDNPILRPPLYIIQQCIHWLFMSYPLVAFSIFSWEKWVKVYSSVYFCGHIFFFVLLVILPFLRKVLVPRKSKEKKSE